MKRIVVTGVTSGIGHATVAGLLNGGAHVVGLARHPDKLAALATGWGEAFHPIVADLADADARRHAIQQIRALGPLDALINNAAECVYEKPLELDLAGWRRLFEVNVLAVIDLMQGVRDLIAPQGQVINISSVTARRTDNARFVPYGLSKTALSQLTDALRAELGPGGIRVSQVTPGLVDTDIYRKVRGFERAEAKLRQALPQWLAPGDVADAILWILSRPPHVAIGDIVLCPTGQTY